MWQALSVRGPDGDLVSRERTSFLLLYFMEPIELEDLLLRGPFI